jgi:uncharacterized membrane protein
MEILELLRIPIGSVFVLFLPGYAWSFVFFKKDEIDLIERIALSFGLSIALVPLIVFWLNWLLKIRINIVTVTAVILGLIGCALVILLSGVEQIAFKKAGRNEKEGDDNGGNKKSEE